MLQYTFRFIKKKHGQDIIMIVRSYESLKAKLMKVQANIKFIKSIYKKKERKPYTNF